MAEQLRVGIIGCGKIADVHHVPFYQALKSVRIVSLLDIKRSQIDKIEAAHQLGAEPFTNFDKFLASGLDAISICTPNYLHCPQTLAALRAGLHVLCEKPMAADTADCTKMIQAARRAGKILQINQTLHYLPLYQTVANLVAKGAIGKPIHVRCIRGHGSSPDIGWSPGAKWFVQEKAKGGVIRDIGVHMADMMQWVVGPVSEIASFVDTRRKGIDVIDNASAIMRFDNGATGVLELSWSMPCGAGMLEIYGTEGTLRQGFSAEHPIEVQTPGAPGKPMRMTYPKVPATAKDSFQSFVDAIRGKAASPTPGEVGREAMALCQAIADSGRSAKFVKVKRF